MTRLVISSLGFGCNDVDESSARLPSPTWAIRAPQILLRTNISEWDLRHPFHDCVFTTSSAEFESCLLLIFVESP
ncbi:hypothetical protein E4U31_000442 [Claviceps sp. LM219 group G6]|nr:hypothetical protein E4U31_000442 [Claviceps sp. LM219 group G6]